jgi:rSAM/selenodomain-associated transferase 2
MSKITVIIPTLDEEADLGVCLAALAGQEGPLEVIVVDGGSSDGTVAIAARNRGVRVVQAPRGRAVQMNAGAQAATGEILWFVHADCRPTAGAAAAIRRVLARDGVSGGAFRFAVAGDHRAYRVVEWGVRLRCRLFRLPYGDQGIFVRRALFEAVGGYRETPILEDLYLVRAVRRHGRLVILPEPMPTSPRRYARDGILRTVLRNQAVLLADWLGFSPQRLLRLRTPAAVYPTDRDPSTEGGKGRKAARGTPRFSFFPLIRAFIRWRTPCSEDLGRSGLARSRDKEP